MNVFPTLTPQHLQHATKVLSQARGNLRQDAARRRAAIAETLLFLILFGAVLALETGMAAMMFSLLQVEVLGHVVSGAAFGLLVPVVIGAAHVQKHRDSDWLTRTWMNRLASVGILLFVLGISSMVGFSAWQAGQDAMSDFASGPSGMLGGQSLFDPNASTAATDDNGFGAVPNTMLFLGLSFGMIISVYFASFCLGRVLQGWATITKPPLAGKAAVAKIDEIQEHIKELHHLFCAEKAAKLALPKNLKQRFAREAGQLCQEVAQAKLAAAGRKFDPLLVNGPLAHVANDKSAETLPARFTSEPEFLQHMTAQMATTSTDHILRVLNANPDQGDKI